MATLTTLAHMSLAPEIRTRRASDCLISAPPHPELSLSVNIPSGSAMVATGQECDMPEDFCEKIAAGAFGRVFWPGMAWG